MPAPGGAGSTASSRPAARCLVSKVIAAFAASRQSGDDDVPVTPQE